MKSPTRSLVWLVVGGAPRSGTTALGAALNQSKKIALFHEYASHTFFDALEGFFQEEDRMRQLGNFDTYAGLMPTRASCAKQCARFLFKSVFKKEARFIGTKFPGYQAWPQPVYPDWISPRIIHITRNPFDVVLSALKKSLTEGGDQSGVDISHVKEHLYWWIHAWNYAVEHQDAPGFLHVFYDDLLIGQLGEKERISLFLDGVDDFSLESFVPPHEESVLDRFSAAGLDEYLGLIEGVVPASGWLEFARNALQNRVQLGFPLCPGETINLSSESDGWKFYGRGFYPPELDGAWTQGGQSRIVFSPLGFVNGALQISFEIIWNATIQGESRNLEIRLDGRAIFSAGISLGDRNGSGCLYSVFVPDFSYVPARTIVLEFLIKDPVNPATAGISKDDRDLGVMINNVVFENFA